MLSWLNLAQVSPGGGFAVGGTFAIQGLISEMELFLHGLGQTGCWFSMYVYVGISLFILG